MRPHVVLEVGNAYLLGRVVECSLAGEVPVVDGCHVEDLGVVLAGAVGRLDRGRGLLFGQEDALADLHVHDGGVRARGERGNKGESHGQADQTSASH